MLLLVAAAVILCFWGGQVTLVVTDFFQSLFVNAMLIGIMVVLYNLFTWDQFSSAFQSAPNGEALLNPFQTAGVSEFNQFFFFVHVYYWMIYSVISWSPNTMLTGSARDAHEARMMRVLLHVRNLAMMGLGLFVLPLAAFVLMNHPDFAAQAVEVGAAVETIANEQVRSQMVTPAAVAHILPVGLLGAFAGVVMFSFITTHDTYLLAWGSVLIQDVIIPLRGKPLPRAAQLKWIHVSVLLVAVFIVAFSMSFQQVDNIFMFMDISASLYTGSAGVVLLGALYWRRGTTKAAWVAMIAGAVLSLSGFVYRIIDPSFLDGRIMAFWVSLICIGLYVVVSLADRSEPGADLDRLLNRRKGSQHPGWLRGKELPGGDRILIGAIVGGIGVLLTVYLGVCVYNLTHDVPTSSWLDFWHIYIYVMFALGSAFLIWISVGGMRDLFRLFRRLETEAVDDRDDGRVD
jgi:SSS family solute:Na+ symporter